MNTAEIVVIGGGIIGTAIAYELAKRGQKPLLVEKQEPGMEASSAAAGVLAVASGTALRGPMYQLKRASLALYPTLLREIEDQTGIDVEYQTVGVLGLVRSDRDEERYRDLYALRREQGHTVSWLSARELRRLEPALTRDARAAVHFGDDCHVDNATLVRAWSQAATRRGVRFRSGTTISEMRREKGRVSAVRIDEGWVATDTVVIAAGCWSRAVGEQFGLTIPVEPAKGQLLAVRATAVRHVISWNDHYVVPRRNGETILGSNVEFVGYNKDVIMETLNRLLERSDDLVPGIARAPLSRFWAGLRPYSPTRRPLLCRAPGLDNVLLATGHYRNGIVLAPITGALIADLITSGQSPVELAPFGLPPELDAARGSSAPSDQTD